MAFVGTIQNFLFSRIINIYTWTSVRFEFPRWFSGKESTCNSGDSGSISGPERSPGGGNSNPLQYSCLENSMAREAWQAAELGVTRSQTQLTTKSTPSEWDSHRRIWGLALPGRLSPEKRELFLWGIPTSKGVLTLLGLSCPGPGGKCGISQLQAWSLVNKFVFQRPWGTHSSSNQIQGEILL